MSLELMLKRNYECIIDEACVRPVIDFVMAHERVSDYDLSFIKDMAL